MARPLTQIAIDSQKAAGKRREVPDGRVSGLYLIVQPSGAKSWAVRYRFDGRQRKFTIGPYPVIDLSTARKKALEALAVIAGDKDPAVEKKATREARRAAQSTKETVAAVAASYIERSKRNLGASWAAQSDRLLRVEIVPVIGSKRLANVARSDLHDLLDAIVDRGAPVTANRALAVFRRLCNWAIERGVITASPCDRIKAPAVEKSRDRVLSDDEIKLVWKAFEIVDWPWGQIAKLLLLTGQRRSEVAGMTWGEVDLAAKTWTIARERSKNGRAHEVPLSDAAMRILQARPHIGDKFVFSVTGKKPVAGFSGAKKELDKAIYPKAIKPWTFHDLRRSTASGMAGLGIAPHVVEATLNHKTGVIRGVAAVYNRYSYATEKRAALDAWARRLEAIVNGAEPSNVVELAAVRQ